MKHPYKELEGTLLWRVVDKAVAELVENQDLEVTTPREYVIGYLAQSLTMAGCVPGDLMDQAGSE